MEIIKSSLHFLEKRRWEEELQQRKMAPSPSSIKKKKIDVRYSHTSLVILFCLIRKGDPTRTTKGCGAHDDEKQLLTSIAGVLSRSFSY